ncbi:MAG: sugar transporter permease [Clostridiales bacterium]|nr:sugar transporter permease [Clostridiales bacterium]
MKLKKLGLKVLVLSVSISIFTGMFVGCSKENKTQEGDQVNAPKGPTKIGMMIGFDGVEFPQPGNEVQTMIEEYTNTKLDIRAYPGKTLHEMLPVTIASGDMPNVISFGGSQLTQAYMVNAFEGGVFWDIAPYISKYPNISKINPMIFDTYKIDGKVFGIPKVRPIARSAYIYRKDWVDALGLKEPKTITEFYELLKAFTKNDPDKNGKNDTFGITQSYGPGSFSIMFGAPNNWAVKDGKFVKAETTPEYIESLKFYKKLMQEGIIHPEIAIMDRSQYEALFFDGKAGVYSNISAYKGYEENVKSKVSSAKLSAFSVLEGPNGKKIGGGTGHNGIMVMPKSSVKNEGDLKNILDFFDKLADEKISNLFQYGIQDKHYKLENGLAVRIPEMNKDFNDKVTTPYAYPIAALSPATNAIKGKLIEVEEIENRLNTENEKYAVPDPSLGLYSETSALIGADHNKILSDAATKFILGSIDEDALQKEIKRWRDGGGDKIAHELAAQYVKNKK